MYKLVGADQKEYGPATLEQVRQWIGEGRANAQTIARFADGPWKALSAFPEFNDLLGGAAGVVSGVSTAVAGPVVPPRVPMAPALSAPAGPRNNSMAVAGLILGILGFLSCCTPLTSTLGLIFSIIGLSQIKQKPELYSGRSLAIAGIVLSILGYLTFPFAFRHMSRSFHWRF